MSEKLSLSVKFLQKFWDYIGSKDQKNIASKVEISEVKEIADINYAGDNDKNHLLDIYMPKDSILPLPVIFDIHGGGWMYGNKELNKFYSKNLAKRGFAVIGINYHLFPSCTMPTPIQDIFMAFNWVLSEGNQYGFDLNNLFLTGDSAGAHYSALALSILSDLNLQKLYNVSSDIKFKGVGFTCGAFDIEKVSKIKLPVAQEYIRLFFGEKKYKNHALYKSLTIKNNKIQAFPPVFLSSSYGDFLKSQTLAMAKLLEAEKVPYSLHFPLKEQRIENKGLQHVYNVVNPEWKDSILVNDLMCDFFKKLIV